MKNGHKPINLIGKKFGLLEVKSEQDRDKRGRNRWLCVCDCGNQVIVLGNNLNTGHTKSCGCAKRKVVDGIDNTTHGMSYTKTYKSWRSLKLRCLNTKAYNYHIYGGRGITVCDRWLNSFENFLLDMGERPNGTQIDRIDSNKGYSPDNCRWVTPKQNARNKRNNRILTFQGISLPVSEWADRAGINCLALRSRLHKGWTVEKALTTPVRRKIVDALLSQEAA